jgi:hypothetical protein
MEILTRRRVTTLRSQRFEMHNGYYLLCLVALILVSPQVGFGGTIIAASPSATNVQTAINGAVDGDIVIVPAGSATWTTGVVVSGKSITIQGAGIDQTIITGATGNPSGSFTLYFTAMNRKPFRVTGITFHSDSVLYGFSEVQAQSDSVGFRIDHCKFTNLTRRGIVAGGAQGLAFTEGLIDHCTFEVAGNFSAQGVTVSANTFTEPPAVGPEGSLSSWVILPQWGTSHYVYIEDCTFNFSIRNDDGVELYDGGRAVIRHCAFINTGIGVHGCDSSAR